MPAGIVALGVAAVFGAAAFAQSGEENQRQDRRSLTLAQSLVDSPRVVSSELISGAGQTGFVSRKKAPKKTQAKKASLASPVNTALAARNPSLLRVQSSAAPTTTGTVSPLRRRRVQEDEPFGPVGFTAGAFLIRPSVELDWGYDSNAERVVNGKGSSFNAVQGAVQAQSQWSRHELTLDMRGSYTAYHDVEGADRPDVQALLRGRVDVTSRTKIELETKFAVTTENPGSPDAIAAVRRQPNVYSMGQTAALVHRFNRFEVTTGIGIERNLYDKAELTNGASVNLEDRNYTAYSARLRGAYELTPDTRPFAEIAFDRRERDLAVDFNGIRRDSDGYTLRGGLSFGRKEWLFGEISAGLSHRDYADPTLPSVSGLIFDAQLTWIATGLTTFRLNAASGIDETSVVGASGVLRREARLTMDHAFRRWLVGTVSVGWLSEEYEGTTLVNDYLRTSAALTYSLNRSLALKAEYRNEKFLSSVAGQDYTANIGLIGIRLQR